MKKLLPVFISIFFLASLILAIYQTFFFRVYPTPVVHPHSLTAQADAVSNPPQVIYVPKLLSIPKIGVNATIVAVGLDSQNRMDVPNNFVDVGWYNLGYKPGEKGSAVLDGHSDNFHGDPAVFYKLDQLSKGDQIIVADQTGKQYTYIVTDNEVYPYDQLPLQQIFASHDQARLNLITCHGQWDNLTQTYNQRTVIYSTLQV